MEGAAGFGDQLPHHCQIIELHVRELNQLFNAMDPAPFRERDLDPNAEAFIVEWARELDARRPLALVVHLDVDAGSAAANSLKHAVREHFKRQASSVWKRLRRLFRTGRTSLVIGLVCLGVAVASVELMAGVMDRIRFGAVIRESLLIGGWVAMWRPLEIFLYDWWPIRVEARLHERLSTMAVRVVPARV